FRADVIHEKVVINSYDDRIRQHRDIYEAASKGNFRIFQIPVDPVFRKSQDKNVAPQLFKENGKGLKEKTKLTFEEMESEIWS
ncbi:MAG: ParA family protein, partial [Sphaerochaetaceae bacterium]|nr:ParA family protein [Sphaerochaetaceae bacterium]